MFHALPAHEDSSPVRSLIFALSWPNTNQFLINSPLNQTEM